MTIISRDLFGAIVGLLYLILFVPLDNKQGNPVLGDENKLDQTIERRHRAANKYRWQKTCLTA
jgi:hypothetical protein